MVRDMSRSTLNGGFIADTAHMTVGIEKSLAHQRWTIRHKVVVEERRARLWRKVWSHLSLRSRALKALPHNWTRTRRTTLSKLGHLLCGHRMIVPSWRLIGPALKFLTIRWLPRSNRSHSLRMHHRLIHKRMSNIFFWCINWLWLSYLSLSGV